ncbi:MAG: hypothetical protein P1U39_08455 [Legionellaceae bacterium]|nr:hypothetical protein [Legionellaceae bacterium]
MYYKNQRVLLASKHEKEKAIADVFLNQLECHVCVEDFDTDQFGTFTGEVERPLTPYETCLLKAKHAGEQFGYHLSVASEGSFGPHPSAPFVPSAHEIMVFIDKRHGWVIAEQLVTQKTNYAMTAIDASTQFDGFLKRVDFPRHALVLQTKSNNAIIAKGIQTSSHLSDALKQGFQVESDLLLSTDMRAMMNPTRMSVLSELADKLAARIGHLCPQCKTPGFGFKSTKGKLPCTICGLLSALHEKEVWGCIQCEYNEARPRHDGLTRADPGYCDNCNP